MKATELRLNNLYFDKRANRTFIVRGIDEGFIDHKDSDHMPTRWEHAEGLPLTEEWLIKLGFERIDENHLYFSNGFIGFRWFPLVHGLEIEIEGQVLPL